MKLAAIFTLAAAQLLAVIAMPVQVAVERDVQEACPFSRQPRLHLTREEIASRLAFGAVDEMQAAYYRDATFDGNWKDLVEEDLWLGDINVE